MKIIKPYIEVMDIINGPEILRKLERCGRTCYKSEDKITQGSAEKFVRGLIKSGHESVIEHQNITVKFICDRGVSHEIVRHRLASYSQESTRYCNYNDELTVIKPLYLDENSSLTDDNGLSDYWHWKDAMGDAEYSYRKLLELGCKPEEARAVLPNSLKTEVVMTANLREWRHFFKQRCQKAAHPQIRELALALLKQFTVALPPVFEDLHKMFFDDLYNRDLPKVKRCYE